MKPLLPLPNIDYYSQQVNFIYGKLATQRSANSKQGKLTKTLKQQKLEKYLRTLRSDLVGNYI